MVGYEAIDAYYVLVIDNAGYIVCAFENLQVEPKPRLCWTILTDWRRDRLIHKYERWI